MQEGFRIDQNEGRQRFVEYAGLLLNGLEQGYIEGGGFFFVDENAERAEAMAYQWIGAYYHTAMKHYDMTAEHFGAPQGYEFYNQVGRYIERHGMDGAARDFASLMPWGTPEQGLEKLAFIRDKIDMNGIMCHFSYAGMPYAEAERNMQCFVKHVLPELKQWQTPPLAEPQDLAMPQPAT